MPVRFRSGFQPLLVVGGGVTPASLIDYKGSTFTGTASSEATSAALAWNANGNRIVVLGATEDNGETINTPTATGLTFSALSGLPTTTGSSCKGYGWSATASGSGSSVISATTSIGIGAGIAAWSFESTDGVGTPVVNVGTGLTVSVTVPEGATVLMILADWNATTDTTVTASPSGANIREAANVSGRATFLALEWPNQAAGTRTYGVTNWTGTGTVTKVAVCVLGDTA